MRTLDGRGDWFREGWASLGDVGRLVDNDTIDFLLSAKPTGTVLIFSGVKVHSRKSMSSSLALASDL